MNWQSRVRRLFSFISIWYEAPASSVVITLRLNTPFVFGAAIAAVVLTLVFKYDGVTFANIQRLLSDLWQGGWWWIGIAVFLALLVTVAGREAGGGSAEGIGFWSRVKAQLPQGVRGTALLCLALLAILGLFMWAASPDAPGYAPAPDARGETTPQETFPGLKGVETPRIYREAQKWRKP
jgi:hypothetical protein